VRAQGQLGPSVRTSLGQKLVPIPAGSFTMGSPRTRRTATPTNPPHPVALDDVVLPWCRAGGRWLTSRLSSRTRVIDPSSSMAWALAGTGQRPVGAGHLQLAATRLWKPKDDEPVSGLAWDDAVAFCDWLSSKDGRSTGSRRRRNGNTPAGPAPPRRTSLARGCCPNRPTSTRAIPIAAAGAVPAWAGRPAWAHDPPNAFGLYDMHATSGSGVPTGTTSAITAVVNAIPRARRRRGARIARRLLVQRGPGLPVGRCGAAGRSCTAAITTATRASGWRCRCRSGAETAQAGAEAAVKGQGGWPRRTQKSTKREVEKLMSAPGTLLYTDEAIRFNRTDR